MRPDLAADVADGVIRYSAALANSFHSPWRDVLVLVAKQATAEVKRLDASDPDRNR